MALVPLKQTVTIRRKDETDDWGNEEILSEFPLKCKFTEVVELTRTTKTSNGLSSIGSQEVVGKGKFIFDKYTEILMTDELIYTDESGKQFTYVPLNIKRVRGLNGKAMMTVVMV